MFNLKSTPPRGVRIRRVKDLSVCNWYLGLCEVGWLGGGGTVDSVRAQTLESGCRGSNTGSVIYVSYVILIDYETLGNLPQFSHLQKGKTG